MVTQPKDWWLERIVELEQGLPLGLAALATFLSK
jgi:hypothetical protein